MLPIIKWILGYLWFSFYYGSDFLGQTLAGSGAIGKFVDYAQNTSENDANEQITAMFISGLIISAIAALPYTLTVRAVQNSKRHSSHPNTSYRELALLDVEALPLLMSNPEDEKYEDNDHSLAGPFEHDEIEEHHYNTFSSIIITITHTAPFALLPYGATNTFAHSALFIKFFGHLNEITIQSSSIFLSLIIAKNRNDLNAHHANAKESYWTLLRSLSLTNQMKGLFYTLTLGGGHGYAGWFDVGYGLTWLLQTLYHFGVPKYPWLPWLFLAMNIYFSGSLVLNATRTEVRSILLAMKQEEQHQLTPQATPSSHWFTNGWLLIATIPQGIRPALGAIQFLNIGYCIVSSNFKDLTFECSGNNLTDQWSFVPRMLVFSTSCLLFSYSGGIGVRETCRKSANKVVYDTAINSVKAATTSLEYLNAAKIKISKYSTALFFKNGRTTAADEKNDKLMSINMLEMKQF